MTSGAAAERSAVFVFTRTTGYRHAAIALGIRAIRELGRTRGWEVAASEDPAWFCDARLSAFGAVVFLNTDGTVFETPEREALKRFLRSGRGFAGVHGASATEAEWPWFGELVGARFRGHPPVQPALVRVEDPTHPATRRLPRLWRRSDEWYSFHTNPRDRVGVLLSVDEASYAPGDFSMGRDHPLAWFRHYDGGRTFYTALGHTEESYQEPEFLEHVAGGIDWALGRA